MLQWWCKYYAIAVYKRCCNDDVNNTQLPYIKAKTGLSIEILFQNCTRLHNCLQIVSYRYRRECSRVHLCCGTVEGYADSYGINKGSFQNKNKAAKVSNRGRPSKNGKKCQVKGGPVFLAHTKQKVSNIVGLTALRLAFFMGYG